MADSVAPRPLVVLTRSVDDNVALATLLEASGVDTLAIPTARLVSRPPLQGLSALRTAFLKADAIAFTSRYGVRAVADLGLLDALRTCPCVAAVGRRTRLELERYDVLCDTQPGASTGAALGRALADRLPPGSLVVCPQAAHARPELRDTLVARDLVAETYDVYENQAPPAPVERVLLRARSATALYFAAPSAADRLLSWDPELKAIPWVAIGPTTARVVQGRHGHAPTCVAQEPTLDAVVAAIATALDLSLE